MNLIMQQQLRVEEQFLKEMYVYLKCYLLYQAAPGLSCGMWDLVPQPGIEPLHQGPVVLATGPPHKSFKGYFKGCSGRDSHDISKWQIIVFPLNFFSFIFQYESQKPNNPIPTKNAKYISRCFRDVALLIWM